MILYLAVTVIVHIISEVICIKRNVLTLRVNNIKLLHILAQSKKYVYIFS